MVVTKSFVQGGQSKSPSRAFDNFECGDNCSLSDADVLNVQEIAHRPLYSACSDIANQSDVPGDVMLHDFMDADDESSVDPAPCAAPSGPGHSPEELAAPGVESPVREAVQPDEASSPSD